MTKLKRVRTGCLTCRERHLKCDEAIPDCINCRKGGRNCHHEAVGFCDESRLIASEYRGGLQRYNNNGRAEDEEDVRSGHQAGSIGHTRLSDPTDYDNPPARHVAGTELPGRRDPFLDFTSRHVMPSAAPLQRAPKAKRCRNQRNCTDQMDWTYSGDWSLTGVFYSDELPIHKPEGVRDFQRASLVCHGPTSSRDPVSEADVWMARPNIHGIEGNDGSTEFIATQDELNYIQAFADGVGVWMDSLNSGNQFTQVIPWYALKSSVLLNSLMACGAKHLSFSKPEVENRAVALYNTATAQLLRVLQNPERDDVDCTTASILLNVYEAMSHKPIHRMSHMVGARALIRKCGWNATSTGIRAACFWLSIGMEVLSCLSMNWTVTWHPDDWGLDLDWGRSDEPDSSIDSQTWVHRSFYILAKVVNFRATSMAFHPSDPHKDQSRLSCRLADWQALKQLCDDWNNCSPRSMRPVGYLAIKSASEPSLFPKFWLAQTSAMLGRIFYHTAQCILAQVNPIESSQQSPEMKELQQHHARQVMGIVASDRGRSVMTIALQAVNVAFLSLVDPDEREEASSILQEAQITTRKAHADVQKMTGQWHLAVMELSELESVSAISFPFEQQPWFMAANVSNAMLNGFIVDQQDEHGLPVDNPLQLAHCGDADQPYKTWFQPVTREWLQSLQL
ncbi:hypothetical protein ED733_008598 [Metarhizium rileyi]|uniref:Zn(2)-C6 fungal-type domain-containing protein n=1 Tax=Metarhizium rileyi (strain RCEF 4871) TaxID=1649241 RepID=A0A5C6GQ45_METRR|nr:hypothetical protein ED733_008598 [Metarhizium rileyi]